MIVSSDERFCLYNTGEGDLLIFSKASGQLYAFDAFGVTLFSFLSEGGSKETLLQTFEDNDDVIAVIHTVSHLFEGREEIKHTTDMHILTLDYPSTSLHTTYTQPFHYRLGFFIFAIDTNNRLSIEEILVAFHHLACILKVDEKVALYIDFITKDDRYTIRFNGKIIHEPLELDALLPRVLDLIRIAYYKDNEYLISLHAGALYFKKKLLLLPAVSGSGKSTLCAYLMHQGFEFLSDEVAMINKDSHICPIPLALAIKEGSWEALENNKILFNDLRAHKRFDGQRLRYLAPANYAKEDLKVEGAYLIFPRYIAREPTSIDSITTLEALSLIITAGYEVIDSYDEKSIREWIGIVETFQKYTITYSDMDDARQTIEKLMEE
ncbi:MAG: hypothetical protein DRG30_08135 [Epsilonproteobacteria bacterium]|nr:MAG: hypothetical protein DRG30_08135 [Campylobacterota bacterium]